MSVQPSSSDSSRLCPYLGLANDPSTWCLFATSQHRCYRWPDPMPIASGHQISFCLSGRFDDCVYQVKPIEDRSGWRYRLGGSPVLERVLSSRQPLMRGAAAFALLLALLLGGRALLDSASSAVRPGTPSSQPPVSAGLASARQGLASAVAAGVSASPAPISSPSQAPSTTVSNPTPVLVAGTQSPPTSAPQAPTSVGSVAPAGSPASQPVAAGPTALPARQPTPNPYPVVEIDQNGRRIYVVQRGDNLYGLARAFNTTVQEIVKVNGLANENFIWTGQRLVIPEPHR